ncbi:MAG: ABC-type multidrug transport system ATPase subunit [Saprospiraceae bacterium]|jgi:ABC-type multidrug transport system ATPase subunit
MEIGMEVSFRNIGKRYRYEWIFRGVNFTFEAGKKYAILGPNGSGKSTLLKVLSGHLTPSKGKVDFLLEGEKLPIDEVYRRISYAAPYIDLIEEFTLTEAIKFHQEFKTFANQLSPDDLIKILNFEKSKDKPVRFFSSGMKQRLKLVLAICSDSPLLLLDEPTTNLDTQGMSWYRDLIKVYGQNRSVIIASNVAADYDFCDETLSILDYKKKKIVVEK